MVNNIQQLKDIMLNNMFECFKKIVRVNNKRRCMKKGESMGGFCEQNWSKRIILFVLLTLEENSMKGVRLINQNTQKEIYCHKKSFF